MFGFINDILNGIMDIINAFGYIGIAGGMFLESACIPIPSEVVLPLGGIMVSNGRLNLLGANLAVTIGSLLGSLTAYAVGHYGGRPFILKYGKYFFISNDNFYKAEKTFNRYGVAAVFFGRLMPVIRTFISLPAGIARMDLKKFVTFSLIGMIPWNFMLIMLGYVFKERFETDIKPFFEDFKYVVIAAIVLIIGIIVARYFLKSRKERNEA